MLFPHTIMLSPLPSSFALMNACASFMLLLKRLHLGLPRPHQTKSNRPNKSSHNWLFLLDSITVVSAMSFQVALFRSVPCGLCEDRDWSPVGLLNEWIKFLPCLCVGSSASLSPSRPSLEMIPLSFLNPVIFDCAMNQPSRKKKLT